MTLGAPGTPAGAVVVEIWPTGHQELSQWTETNQQGVAVFSGIDPGEWILHIVAFGPSGACEYEFDSLVVLHETTARTARIWQHHPIAGVLWFKNAEGQVIAGDPWNVSLVLLEGGEPVGAVTPMVNTTANPDGSYPYSVPSEFLLAGDYALRASLGEATVNENVSYPNGCGAALGAPFYTHRAPGAHAQVEGPDLVLVIDE